ncbi:MAG TPA: ABC transporter ATP-binding protein [Sphingobacteriaceae bacterium]
MIEIKDLKKTYGGTAVVHIPELSFTAGETIGLVGNNGAGKTTLFRIMLDLIRPDTGSVLSRGHNVAGNEAWKDYTASYLDEGFLIDYLLPEEYFYFIGGLHGLGKAEIDSQLQRYADFFNGEILNRKKYIRDLSKGNQAKVGVIAALLQNPELLLLDEPFANIDPSTQIRLKNLLRETSGVRKVTTIISSHDLNQLTDVCGRIILMEKGKIIRDMQTDKNTLAELEEYFSVLQ